MLNRLWTVFKGRSPLWAGLIVNLVLIVLSSNSGVWAMEVDFAGAHPAPSPVIARQTRGWHDIYLTHHRICRSCQMTDLGGERVELANRTAVNGVYFAHEIIGVDYHPWQRKFLEQVAGQTNTDATRVLLPHYFPQKWDSEHAHYAGFYDAP